MKNIILLTTALILSFSAFADEKSACTAAAGSLVTGEVVTPPVFKGGKYQRGVQLSHTHFTVKSDKDGKRYDVAADNVFASGYQKNSQEVPAPLNSIKIGDHVSLCGQLYTSGTGIHWVHTNCGAKPKPNKPNGWIKILKSDGSESENFEDSQNYCKLW